MITINRTRTIKTALILVLIFCLSPTAQEETEPGSRLRSFFSGIGRGFTYVGQKASYLIPGLHHRERGEADYTNARDFNERYQIAPDGHISISNEFGEIRVQVWQEEAVQVSARIVVGAKSSKIALTVSDAINIETNATTDSLTVRTILPETNKEEGLVTMAVNYVISVPASMQLLIQNRWGDTIATGVGTPLVIDAQYGAIEIVDAPGRVTVRSHGNFPVIVRGLDNGGVFELNGAEARFDDVGGELKVRNFQGSIFAENMQPTARYNIASESGPINVIMPTNNKVDLLATAIFGVIDTNLALPRTLQGDSVQLAAPHPKSSQQLILNATFANITINEELPETPILTENTEKIAPFKEVIDVSVQATTLTQISINSIFGDLRIEGYTGDEVRITATKLVSVADQANADNALEALVLKTREVGGHLIIETQTAADMDALGCNSYQVNLLIQSPRKLPVEIKAVEGLTVASGIENTLTIQQISGRVTAENIAGAMIITNQHGAIEVSNCTGTVNVSAQQGDITLKSCSAPIQAQCIGGRTVIEGPQDDVTVLSSAGDVRIIALNKIGGEFNIQVNQGHLSMVIAPNADATLSLKAQNGIVHQNSAIKIDGSMTRNTHEFYGRLKDGLHLVRLETRDGDIFLD